MTTPNERYQYATEYLHKLYETALYERHGIRHPVVFHAAQAAQRDDVDSVLGPAPSDVYEQAMLTVYNYAYLHTLQNSKRHLFNGTTFSLKQLHLSPLRVEAAFGKYFDMIATCAAFEKELLDSATRHFIRLPLRSQYHLEISPKQALQSGRGRSAALGCAVLVVFKYRDGYCAILSRRTAAHATRPGALHLLPAFIFQPMGQTMQAREWRLRHHIYREWLEELFGMAESDSTAFYEHPALVDLQQMEAKQQAALHLAGVSFNLMTLRAEFCVLLLIHDAHWWQRVHTPDSAMKLNTKAETSDDLLLIPLESDAAILSALPEDYYLNMPPQAVPAFWQGIDLVREILGDILVK